MKNINIYSLFLFIFFGSQLYSQQEVNFNMYRYNVNLINPAFTGVNGTLFANLSLRTQWVGVKDAPETQALSAGIPNNKLRLGTGFSIINDKTFIENQTQFFADFSYHLPLGEGNDIYLGIKAGGTSILLQANKLLTFGSNQNDQYLTNQSSFVPNIGVGVYFKNASFFASLSIPRLLSTERFRYDDGQISRATDRPHIYGLTGSRIIINENWSFLPSGFFSYVKNTPFDFMLNSTFAYQRFIEFGLLYAREGGIGGTTFFNLNDTLQFGYSYVTSGVDQLTRFSKGSHEFILKFKFNNTLSKTLDDSIKDIQTLQNDYTENKL